MARHETFVPMDQMTEAQIDKEMRRGILRKCRKITAPGAEYTIHFHIPSIFMPWSGMYAGIVNNDTEVGHYISPQDFEEIIETHAITWMEAMAIVRRNLEAL